MLEITSRQNFDIFTVILVIAKYNLQTSISRKRILIKDTVIPSDVIDNICQIVPSYTVRNYLKDTQPIEISETHTDIRSIGKTENAILKYKSTRQGEVFYCDFGTPFEHEIGYQRPAIVLWSFDDRVLVLPCTTNMSIYEGKFKISFKDENFQSYDKPMSLTESMGIIDQLRVVDKARLKVKIGTLTNEFFKEILLTIQTYFLFQVNLPSNQLAMLEMNINKMQEIISSKDSDFKKINNILIAYGFNPTSNGYSYLRDAILLSLELDSFNIAMLSQKIAENISEKDTPSEVERLIIARFKEVFGKKHKTSEFIRLIRTLLKEGKA